MHKLKSTFLRPKELERRTQQFLKRHPTAMSSHPFYSDDQPVANTPSIHLDELSEVEKRAYSSWWKDLDPFNLGRLDNKTALVFLNGCGLPDSKLEEILQLFLAAVGGLVETEFYAMLRLIAHAQNGRHVSRDMIFMGGKAFLFLSLLPDKSRWSTHF
ncbi:hypothetical protein BDF14DRAFT_1724568 [Spinellus fusiger]|nr:hypothetical protein BDF14DRAFT_1724568 [Spinellus fusiger]